MRGVALSARRKMRRLLAGQLRLRQGVSLTKCHARKLTKGWNSLPLRVLSRYCSGKAWLPPLHKTAEQQDEIRFKNESHLDQSLENKPRFSGQITDSRVGSLGEGALSINQIRDILLERNARDIQVFPSRE